MRGTKYLSEIMENIELSQDKNNLILAPIGSGKTHYALDVLMSDKTKKYLYLCDNSNLKNQILNEKTTYSTKRDSDFYKFAPNILVMTYTEFGCKILYDIHEEYIKQFDLIIADEIHSCVEYSEFNQDRNLSKSLEFLMIKHDTPIILMTATSYYLDQLVKVYPSLCNYNIINLLDNEEIKRYIDKVKLYINNISQIKFYLQQSMDGFKFGGMKAGIYTKQIKDMITIETMCRDLGLKPICIWSEHNKNGWNDEQKDFMKYLFDTGKFKDPYNILIFNKAMETGINIKDDDVDLCIVNSINLTEQIQARGRFRKDINLVVVKTKETALPEIVVTLDDKYLNRWISLEEFMNIMNSLNIKDSKGRLIGKRAFIKALNNSKYIIKNKRKTINKIKETYYYITK